MPTRRDRPWLRYYGAAPAGLDYPRVTLYEAVAATAQRSPQASAWDFFGTTATYRELLASIDAAAAALMDAKICRRGKTDELPPGEEGEICISGPAVMAGCLDDAQATAETLKVHADGRIWLHTGDRVRRDEDGFFYFTVRAKRMIKSSGFNVYPAQVESVLYQHPAVLDACVIGVPDEAQVERVEAVVVLKGAAQESDATAQALIEFCRERLIKWSCPREIEFRRELPKTRVGTIDFKALVAEHAARSKG